MNNLMTDLKVLRRQGILQDIDLELCRFLQEHHDNISEEVLIAACLVSYLYRQGDVCLLLENYAGQPIFDDENGQSLEAPDLESWKQALENSSIVGSPGNFKPLILDNGCRLYLHKLWHYEDSLADHLIRRSQLEGSDINVSLLEDGLNRLFPNANKEEIDWQRVAAAQSVRHSLSIISGGPGTGKTSTVVRILALLLEQVSEHGTFPSIALAAPTGKAAARLKDSLTSAKQELDVGVEVRAAIPDQTMTLHQLLGARRHSSSFKYDEENPVPYDIVVVDEASMVDQALMSKLLNALLEDTRLILLGDKDQLASVEAGSVLGDICYPDQNQFSKEAASWAGQLSLEIPADCIVEKSQPLTDHITLLTKSYRFDPDSGIAQLAELVNAGNPDQAIEVLDSPGFEDASLIPITDQSSLEEVLHQRITSYFRGIIQTDSVSKALDKFDEFRILCAHRRGPWGVEYLNKYVEQILQRPGLIPKYQQWYPGKPVIINVNDYTLGLNNGDTGVCLPDENGELKIHFHHEGSVRSIAPGRLPDHSTAFALTVHKGQGSEFDDLLFILPEKLSKVLSRELIYTAITRARTSITILGNKRVLKQGIGKKLERSSGLKKRLWMA